MAEIDEQQLRDAVERVHGMTAGVDGAMLAAAFRFGLEVRHLLPRGDGYAFSVVPTKRTADGAPLSIRSYEDGDDTTDVFVVRSA